LGESGRWRTIGGREGRATLEERCAGAGWADEHFKPAGRAATVGDQTQITSRHGPAGNQLSVSPTQALPSHDSTTTQAPSPRDPAILLRSLTRSPRSIPHRRRRRRGCFVYPPKQTADGTRRNQISGPLPSRPSAQHHPRTEEQIRQVRPRSGEGSRLVRSLFPLVLATRSIVSARATTAQQTALMDSCQADARLRQANGLRELGDPATGWAAPSIADWLLAAISTPSP
jgi:hypothetical protein